MHNLTQLLQSGRTRFASKFMKTSFAQCGEDIIVNYIFSLRGLLSPTYIDIGANHPFFINNTAIFYEKGCRGINIEANPMLIGEFNKYRPNDINLNVGISIEEGESDFFILEDNTLSTFSKSESDNLQLNGKKLLSIEKVKLTPIENILKKYFNDQFPDFLSIDVEGLDFTILQSIDFNKHFPKVICVEVAEYSAIGTGAKKTDL